MNRVPSILCIGGHDPTGGAGIQADIETVTALGGRALTLVTALTAQDTHNISAIEAVRVAFFGEQLDRLLDDIRPDAIKIGLLGSTALVPVLEGLLQGFGGPVVLDPVLAAGGGFDLDSADLVEAIATRLVPLTGLLTPNRAEARRLSGRDDADHAARALLKAGAAAIMLTGADEAAGAHVINRLFTATDQTRSFKWPLLPHAYHGSGCTLASACATRLAFGDDLVDAVEQAQRFTWQALRQSTRPGGGQWLPRRHA
jgi:hydroxymethylpyrimidine/phosphomethylpyrimidine kinase